MSRRCELTGIGPMVGHNVSHSNIKTKRRFLPSLKTVKVTSDALGQTFSLRISNAARRPVVVDGMVNASGPGAGHLDPGTALPAAAVPPGGGEER